MALGLILVGFGAGWSFIAVTIAAVARAEPEETGLASGVINAAQQVGGAIALAVWVSVAAARTTALAAGGASQLTAQVGGYRLAFIVGAGISASAAIVAAAGLRSLTADEAQKAAHELHALYQPSAMLTRDRPLPAPSPDLHPAGTSSASTCRRLRITAKLQ